MASQIDNIKLRVERWLKTRYALPVIFVLAVALFWVSERTYRNTTTTLRSGIELTDARVKSLRLLQLLTETEAAELGYLLTKQPSHLAEYTATKATLMSEVIAVSAFFAAQGSGGEAAALRVAEFTRLKIEHIDQTLETAQRGDFPLAIEMARDQRNRATSAALRTELTTQLSYAAHLQEHVRTSIFDALALSRVEVGVLTLSTMLSLFWLVRQLIRQDRDRADQQVALLQERDRLEVEVQKRTARLTELAKHLQSVREDERNHLARELHDEMGALLTACKLEIARARIKKDDPVAIQSALERINTHLNVGIALKRRIIEDLRPSALSNLGLGPALENLCREMSHTLGLPVQLSVADFSLSPDADLAVYRFVQEALTNIGRYARASNVKVILKVVGDNATAEVSDDGVGFELQDTYLGQHGLSGMQFRAESLGGSMQVRSSPGQGSTVRIEFAQLASAELRPDNQVSLK